LAEKRAEEKEKEKNLKGCDGEVTMTRMSLMKSPHHSKLKKTETSDPTTPTEVKFDMNDAKNNDRHPG
jgi:hypothetical protein